MWQQDDRQELHSFDSLEINGKNASESGFHEKYGINALLCLLAFTAALFHKFGLVIKNVKGVICFLHQNRTLYTRPIYKAPVCGFTEERSSEKSVFWGLSQFKATSRNFA